MADYRFFGSESALSNGMTLTKYGEMVHLEPAAADALIAERPPALLLPVDLWDKCGITDAELAEFPSAAIHGAAPEDFRAKTKAVRAAFHEYREGLLKTSKPAAAPALPIAPAREAHEGVAVTDETFGGKAD